MYLLAGWSEKMGAKIDLTGIKFGRLTVVSVAGRDKYGSFKWVCRCDCGKEVVVSRTNLRSGHTKSCGCLAREVSRNQNGLPHSHLSRVRNGMKQRCYDNRCKQYKYYGGRGIKICDEWMGPNGRENFVRWAISNGFEEGLTIDRIDVNGDYSPDNCRWITQAEQCRNKRTNLFVVYQGRKMCVSEASRLSGIKKAHYSSA